MMKKKLQELFPNNKLMTVRECFDVLGWICENEEGMGDSTGEIKCKCGSVIEVGGWVGSEHAHCPKCHLGMQNVTGFLPAGNSVCTHIDFEATEIPKDDRVWIPENVWGF